MFKQSPSRNQRSKGFKIKHALQIGLLLAVCIWLIYQVKHSHDKKKVFDESAAKLLEKIESQHDIIKFGRKDLHPRVEETTSENVRHDEEDQTQEEEEDSKHEEEEEQEEEENKPEESEDERRGAGDDEIDEHEQERTEVESKREEDFVDEEEERDRQDNENEGKELEEKQTEESEVKENEEETKEGSEEKENEEEPKEESAEKANEEETKEREDQIEEQDHDRNTQEAREEHYKADDASSAVVRDTQAVRTEAEGGVLGNSNEEEHVENLLANELEMENKTNNLEEVTSDHNNSSLKADGETTGGNSVNATEVEEKATEINLSKLEDGSLPNSTTTTESIDLQELNNSSTVENAGTQSSSLQNGTESTDTIQDRTVVMITSNGGVDLDHQPVLLEQAENSNMTAETLRSDSNSVLSTTENENASKGESEESSSNSGTVQQEEQNTGAEGNSESSTTNGNGDQNEKYDTTTESEDNSSSSTNENSDEDQYEKSETTTESEDNSSSLTTNDDVDSIESKSDDSLIPEVKEARTDLGTLPEIETEGNNSEDVAAER